jgi:uncharacterized protein (DUF1330 family)
MIALFALAAVAAPAAPMAAPDPVKCDNRPVVMMVEGMTKDAKRLDVYAAAIRASGLYQKLGGYYLVNPRPVAVFEGVSPPERSVIAVRFPCFAHARAFWNSKEYREKIVPLRSNPAAGDFVVTVHMALPVPDYAAGPSSMDGIAQIAEGAK